MYPDGGVGGVVSTARGLGRRGGRGSSEAEGFWMEDS